MKSSSGINIGNGNTCRENRKTTTTSHPSSTISKRVTKTNTPVIKPTAAEQQQQLDDFIQPAQSFYTNSISSFQSESVSSKFKFEITPETINHFHTTDQHRRPRIQWVKRHASLHSKSKITSTNSSVDFMTTTLKPEVANLSITAMTSKDFAEEYQTYPEQNEVDQTTLKCTSINLVTDDDDDDDNDEKDKLFIAQENQPVIIDEKPKKKIKSAASHHKKIKSASRRPKLPSATQVISQMTISSLSPTRTASQAELNPGTMTKLSMRIDENNLNKNSISVDTTKSRSNLEVVRLCLRDLGWRECAFPTTLDSDIYWHSSSFHEGNPTFPFSSGRVNKFPGMNDLLRKVHLTRSLNNMRVLFPNDFDFYPKTWFLPEQTQQFKDDVRYIHQQDKKHNRSLTTFIVKPSDGSQGEGIYLLRDPAHCIVTNRPHVVQEYIERPLLINGLKFDLRIYVLILNLYPLEIFLYDEGLVRFATVDYKAPSTDNLHQTYMHLTNYSLNKRSSSYKHTVDNSQTDGSKRKLTTVWTQLIHMFGQEKIDRTKILITEMINKTILAILPELRVEYEFELPLGKKQNISCFQIVGFDIILTDHLKPILLEVNANPSLRIDFDKEIEKGKFIYQPSPIDEEIKKPLVLETLKLALPKKKLYTFTRHAQLQMNDELMAQRVEKVAQRRVEERNEKLKSERKTRFNLKSNPFFSRPPENISKDFARLQQEQQEQINPQQVLITTPTTLNESSHGTMRQISPISDRKSRLTTASKSQMKTRKLANSIDDDESGSPIAGLDSSTGQSSRNHLYHSPSASMRRSVTKSATSTRQLSASETIASSSIKKLKIIFPLNYKARYRHLFLLDKIAYIYIQLVIMLGHKTMTGGQFRNFTSICGIINETITAPSIDILYYQIQRKWQQFVLRNTASTGLPFTAFIEAMYLLSQRKYPTAHSLLDSVSQLVNECVRNLNSYLQTPSSPLIQQSNQYLLHRATRINSSTNPSVLNNRSSIIALRSTTMGTNRTTMTSTSAPTPRSHPTVPSATAVTTATSTTTATNNSEEKSKPSSAKSVFPLFFDVL